MIVYVLDKNFKQVDILRYTFLQYDELFRDIGTFNVQIKLNKSVIYLLDVNETYYLLFENDVIGKIENIKKDEDETEPGVVTITGRLSSMLFTKRIIYKTMNISDKTYKVVESLIKNNMIESTNNKRNIPAMITYETQNKLDEICNKVNKQYTGGYLWDSIQDLLEYDKLGIVIKPVIVTKQVINSIETNVSHWVIKIMSGSDRRRGNKEGNSVVLFSQSLSNISGTTYEQGKERYCNTSYVAGEGEGEDRKWYEFPIDDGDIKTGWERSELWVDARDITSMSESGTELTDSEYEQLIVNRMNEKMSEATKTEEYDSSIVQNNKQYLYGRDYFLGDWVTIKDDELGMEIDAQIIGVTTSIVQNKKITDIVFFYGSKRKDTIRQMIETKNRSNSNDVNIKYLESMVKQLTNKSEPYVIEKTLYFPGMQTRVENGTLIIK